MKHYFSLYLVELFKVMIDKLVNTINTLYLYYVTFYPFKM